jgi:hypothetical protein
MNYGTSIIKAGAIIRTSRNLRGMRDYARVSPVVRIQSGQRMGHEKDPGGIVIVTYADGAECRADFASYHIMVDWLRNRRTWRGADHRMHGPNLGYLTKPGTIAGVSP